MGRGGDECFVGIGDFGVSIGASNIITCVLRAVTVGQKAHRVWSCLESVVYCRSFPEESLHDCMYHCSSAQSFVDVIFQVLGGQFPCVDANTPPTRLVLDGDGRRKEEIDDVGRGIFQLGHVVGSLLGVIMS